MKLIYWLETLFAPKVKEKPAEPYFTEEPCWVVTRYSRVLEGVLRKMKSGKMCVKWDNKWAEALADGSTLPENSAIIRWFQ